MLGITRTQQGILDVHADVEVAGVPQQLRRSLERCGSSIARLDERAARLRRAPDGVEKGAIESRRTLRFDDGEAREQSARLLLAAVLGRCERHRQDAAVFMLRGSRDRHALLAVGDTDVEPRRLARPIVGQVKLLHVAHVLRRAPVLGSVQPSNRSIAVLMEGASGPGVHDVGEQLPPLTGRRQHVPVPGHTHRLARTPLRAVQVVAEQLHVPAELRVERVLRGGRVARHVSGHRFPLRRRQGVDVARAGDREAHDDEERCARRRHEGMLTGATCDATSFASCAWTSSCSCSRRVLAPGPCPDRIRLALPPRPEAAPPRGCPSSGCLRNRPS